MKARPQIASQSFWTLLRDTRRVRRDGQAAFIQRQRARLADLAAFARIHSPLYQEYLRNVPERVTDTTQLPVTDKRLLMSRFDEWSTDREITLERARASRGKEAQRAFLVLMREHHGAAVIMADEAVARAADPRLRAFAYSVRHAQPGQIRWMSALLLADSPALPRRPTVGSTLP